LNKKKLLGKSDRELLFLSWPIFVELFLRVVIGNVNVWMISHYSEPAVAAVSAANQLLNLTVFIYGFITVGTHLIIEQVIGAKKTRPDTESHQYRSLWLIVHRYFDQLNVPFRLNLSPSFHGIGC
jgi:Na+-driven multidrug efflux pump